MTRTHWLTILGAMILAASLEPAAAQTTQTQPYDAISPRAIEIFQECEKMLAAKPASQPGEGDLVWGESWLMMGYLAMFEATGDPRYLDTLLKHIEDVLARRSDRLGQRDEYREKVMPAWVVYETRVEKTYAHLVHAGMLTYPMARCAVVLKRDPALAARHADRIQRILADVAETVKAFEPDFRPGPADTEGYYYYPLGKTDVPYYHQNAMGRTLITMYQATGDRFYRDRAEKLGEYLRERLRKLESGRYVWDAWTRSPTFEDTSHAAIDVEFAFACFRGGIVFSRGDIRRLIATLKEVSRDGKLTYRVDGAGQSGRPIQIGMWGLLAHVDPQIRQAILDFLVAGYQEQPVIGMVSAGYLVQTERPFEVEASLTPVTQPSNTGPGQQN